jgi:hypothetical protein
MQYVAKEITYKMEGLLDFFTNIVIVYVITFNQFHSLAATLNFIFLSNIIQPISKKL